MVREITGVLSRKQEQAIAALLTTRSLSQAASKAGIATKTLWNWLQRPDFAAEYRKARGAIITTVIGQLARAGTRAVRCLMRNLRCGNPAVEVKAAQAVIEMALGAANQDELLRRLEELEQQAATSRLNIYERGHHAS